MSSISVLGGGAFGTAYAVSLASDGRKITLWARNPGDMNARRENTRRLPGVRLPDTLRVTGDFAEAAKADIILLAIPLQKLSAVLAENAVHLTHQTLVCCSKGIDIATGRGPAEIIAETCPGTTPAILSGPSFAIDIATGLPTALTLAATHPEALQEALTTPNIRLYRSTDITGVELGGALKNVFAIACGIAIGAGLGESARAALMTRGYAEMSRFAQSRGARPETLAGLSGFGDLALTCTSEKSRNYSYGLALGHGEAGAQNATIEGKSTARAVVEAAGKEGLDMPIAKTVMALVTGATTTEQAVAALLSRPLKEE